MVCFLNPCWIHLGDKVRFVCICHSPTLYTFRHGCMTCGKGESTGLTKSSAVAAFRQAKETGACRCLSPQPSDDWDFTRAQDGLISNRKTLTSKDVTVLLFCIVNKFAVKDVDIHVHISRSWFSSSPLDLLTKSRSSCVFWNSLSRVTIFFFNFTVKSGTSWSRSYTCIWEVTLNHWCR